MLTDSNQIDDNRPTSRRRRNLRRLGLATVAGVLCTFAAPSPVDAAFVVGASSTSGAPSTCTFTAVKPSLSSGQVRATFTVKCTVITTITYGIQVRESDFTAGFQTVISSSGSFYVAKAGTTYTVASATAACSSTTALGTGANTESTREELYTYATAFWGAYTAKFEQTAVPGENSSASFAC